MKCVTLALAVLVLAVLAMADAGPSALAQSSQQTGTSRQFTKLAPGEFTITPSTPKGFFVVEAKNAKLLPLLKAVFRRAHHTLIISDQGAAILERATASTSHLELSASTLDNFVNGIALAKELSWDKVGQETYVVVPKVREAGNRKVIKPERRRGDYWRPVPED